MKTIVVTGGFDDIRSRHLRFLQEAAKSGAVTVLLWPDEALASLRGRPPKFPLGERQYFLEAVRYVRRVIPADPSVIPDRLPMMAGVRPAVWVDGECRSNAAREAFCRSAGIEYRVLGASQLEGFPEHVQDASSSVRGSERPGGADAGIISCGERRKKVVVTGCYDWFHSGHVRFFEEVSAYGDLHVIIGHDTNIRLLKGAGHPLVPQDERRYVVGSIKYVTQVLIATGTGWLDADPEIRRLQPDLYAVNEDGDRGGKREYCAQHGIEYLVLKRTPAPGLPRRSSTDLRGF